MARSRKINKYHKIIAQWLTEYAQTRNSVEMEYQCIIDTKNLQYQVVRVGWNKGLFVYNVVFHLQIKETGKIWFYVNNTDIEIDEELNRLGIPFSDMVVGFYPPEMRVQTKYAVG